MMEANVIGILGGTFDPAHLGHIAMAQGVLEKTPVSKVLFVPCYDPPHREQPIALPEDRLAMLQLALKDDVYLDVDDREIARKGKSYMIDTLKTLKQDFSNATLCLILGWDAFAGLSAWHEWQALNDYANFIVINRPDMSVDLSPEIQLLLKNRETKNRDDLLKKSQKIYLLNLPPISISATQIRQRLRQKQSIAGLLPPLVEEYIQSKKIYGWR